MIALALITLSSFNYFHLRCIKNHLRRSKSTGNKIATSFSALIFKFIFFKSKMTHLNCKFKSNFVFKTFENTDLSVLQGAQGHQISIECKIF